MCLFSGAILSKGVQHWAPVAVCLKLRDRWPQEPGVRGLKIVSLVVTDDDCDDKLDGEMTNQRAAMRGADQSEALCTEVTGAVLILGG